MAKPYYQHAGITIYHGDTRELMPELGDGIVVTDPPYNVGYSYDVHDDTMNEHAYRHLLGATLRLPAVVIHYPEPMFMVADAIGVPPQKVVAWVYNSNNARQHRSIAWFGMVPDFGQDGQEYKNPTDRRIQLRIANGERARLYDWWEIQQVKNVSEEKTEHPCQIPLELMRRVLLVTPYDGPVIDPFMGSGSTLRAAKDLGRTAIGIELSERYCEIAANRLRQEVLLCSR